MSAEIALNIGLPQIGSLETETAEAKAAGLDEAAEAGGYSCYQHLHHAVVAIGVGFGRR